MALRPYSIQALPHQQGEQPHLKDFRKWGPLAVPGEPLSEIHIPLKIETVFSHFDIAEGAPYKGAVFSHLTTATGPEYKKNTALQEKFAHGSFMLQAVLVRNAKARWGTEFFAFNMSPEGIVFALAHVEPGVTKQQLAGGYRTSNGTPLTEITDLHNAWGGEVLYRMFEPVFQNLVNAGVIHRRSSQPTY